MSRHRGLPRATLSTDTLLQSPRKDMLRQPFAKFHNAHPAQPAISFLNTPRHPCDSLLHSAQHTMTSQAYHTAILHLFQNLSPPIPSSGADSIPTFAIGERHHITGWQHSAIPSLRLQLVSGVMVAEFRQHSTIPSLRLQLVSGVMVAEFRQHSTIPFLRLQLAGWHVCIRKRYAT